MISLLSAVSTVRGVLPLTSISRVCFANKHRSVFLRAATYSVTVPSNKALNRKYLCHQRKSFLTAQSKMSSSSTSDLVAKHDPESKKFFIKLGDVEAKLEYVKKGDVLDMWHTEVPPALQGKGIAKILAQEAFDYVIKQNLKMKLTCTYLQKYYKDNPKPEYLSRVV